MTSKREKNLKELEEWSFKQNFPPEELEPNVLTPIGKQTIQDKIADEAQRRFGVSRKTAQDYADVIVFRFRKK